MVQQRRFDWHDIRSAFLVRHPWYTAAAAAILLAAGAILSTRYCGRPPEAVPPALPAAGEATPAPSPIPTLEAVVAATPTPEPTATPAPTVAAALLPTHTPTVVPTIYPSPYPSPTPAITPTHPTPTPTYTSAPPTPTLTPAPDELVNYFNALVSRASQGQTVGVAFYNDDKTGCYKAVTYNIGPDGGGRSRTFTFSRLERLLELAETFGVSSLQKVPDPRLPSKQCTDLDAYRFASSNLPGGGFVRAVNGNLAEIVKAIRAEGKYGGR